MSTDALTSWERDLLFQEVCVSQVTNRLDDAPWDDEYFALLYRQDIE